MKLETKHFGEIDVDESKLITFKDSIPGFPHCTRFVLLHQQTDEGGPEQGDGPEADGLICWMQSVDDSDVAFVLMNVCAAKPDYNPLIGEEDIAELGDYSPEHFLVYNIAVVAENMKDVSVNLKAPVVINAQNRLGKQVVVTNEDYAIRYRIFNETEMVGKG